MKESGEMYLETILILQNEKENVRAIDIVDKMNFSKPSVSRALSRLKEEECITVDRSGIISFTEKGRSVAEKIYERHHVLTDLLCLLGVSRDTAAKDACRIEHDISEETFEAVKKYMRSPGTAG